MTRRLNPYDYESDNENGIYNLWEAVLNHALETATNPLPNKTGWKMNEPRNDRDNAIRFFNGADSSTLEFICEILNKDLTSVRKYAMYKINGEV